MSGTGAGCPREQVPWSPHVAVEGADEGDRVGVRGVYSVVHPWNPTPVQTGAGRSLYSSSPN